MIEFYEYSNNHKQAHLEELMQFLRQKSISATGEGIEESAEMLKGFMVNAGIDAKIMQTEGHPIVYGEIKGKGNITVLIYGHYDVQPADDINNWQSNPFEPEIRDGKIFCRGSSDDKGQLFVHIKAVEGYSAVYGELPLNIKFLFEGEEEVGSPNLETFVKENRELLKSDLVIVSDSHIHESGRPVIILGLKGMLYVEMRFFGANRELHSKFAAAVDNPAWKAVKLLNSLLNKNGEVNIDGFYDDVKPPLPEELKAMNEIPFDESEMLKGYGVKVFRKGRFGDNYFYNMMFEPTCNIDGIYSGYCGEGSKTTLPNKASVKMDFRLVPGQDPDRIEELLKNHLSKHGFDDTELKVLNKIKPCRVSVNNPFVKVISEAITEVWKETPLIYPSIGGSGPNYIFTEQLGIECITVPIAAADQNNHGPDESLILKGFYNGIKTSGEIIKRISENLCLDLQSNYTRR